jgi:heat-inducible transcriptional repressor
MISERQTEILNSLIKEYINTAEPVSSKLLKEKCGFDCSAATIRNDLQELMEMGFVEQPHTSAGRIPTQKAYRIFIESISEADNSDNFSEFIFKEMKQAREQIEQELKLAEELTKSLTQFSVTLSIKHTNQFSEKDDLLDILNILGSAKPTHEKNIEIIKSLLKEFNI